MSMIRPVTYKAPGDSAGMKLACELADYLESLLHDVSADVAINALVNYTVQRAIMIGQGPQLAHALRFVADELDNPRSKLNAQFRKAEAGVQ